MEPSAPSVVSGVTTLRRVHTLRLLLRFSLRSSNTLQVLSVHTVPCSYLISSVLCNIVMMGKALLLTVLATWLVKKKRLQSLSRTRRSKWSRTWLLWRQNFSHVKLLRQLHDEPNDWRNNLRMNTETYSYLLELVASKENFNKVQ